MFAFFFLQQSVKHINNKAAAMTYIIFIKSLNANTIEASYYNNYNIWDWVIRTTQCTFVNYMQTVYA